MLSINFADRVMTLLTSVAVNLVLQTTAQTCNASMHLLLNNITQHQSQILVLFWT